MESQKWTTTQIAGGGGSGSGYVHQGSGFSSSAPISSTTATYDQVFVKAASGEERALEFANVPLAVRRGQRLSLLWAVRSGGTAEPYVAILNHNTGALDYLGKAINDVCGPMLCNALLVVAVLAAAFGGGGPAALGIGYPVWLKKRAGASGPSWRRWRIVCVPATGH